MPRWAPYRLMGLASCWLAHFHAPEPLLCTSSPRGRCRFARGSDRRFGLRWEPVMQDTWGVVMHGVVHPVATGCRSACPRVQTGSVENRPAVVTS